MKTTRYRFEQEVESVTEKKEARAWLYEAFQAILESDKEYTRKADYIGFSLLSLDKKIAVIEEEVSELQALKKRLKAAKELSLEIGAKALHAYGITKIEGAGISSLTLTKERSTAKPLLTVTNETKLIQMGYYKKVLDTDALIDAYNGADEREKIQRYCHVTLEQSIKPAKLKINRRRSQTKKITLQEQVS